MINRIIEKEINEFLERPIKEALLVTGARQVGKTFTIRKCAQAHDYHFVEFNLIKDTDARKLFSEAKNSEEFFILFSALTNVPLIPGKTLIFFDEVQEVKEIVTAIKFLVEDGRFRYILSGSLLGVELKDIRSAPVGYLRILEMFPLTFFEFCSANKVSDSVMEHIRQCFEEGRPVEELIHQRFLDLFYLYLIVGGMPAAVDCFLQEKNIRNVSQIQQSINNLYLQDIAKYDPNEKLYLKDIYELIPSELNAKNKRFILKNLNENFKFNRFQNSFLWLKDAGVALPTFCAAEPIRPLRLSRSTNLFKLFLCDVGLLCNLYADGIQLSLLKKELDINYGAIFENAVAQQLHAAGFALYYFNSKKQGEIDFLLEYENCVIPIEVKSGKTYQRHNALTSLLSNEDYQIPYAYVFSCENVESKGKVRYCPIYMLGFLQRQKSLPDEVYDLDLSVLQKDFPN